MNEKIESEGVRRTQELRRSHAHGTHRDRRLRRLLTRGARKKQAIRDSREG